MSRQDGLESLVHAVLVPSFDGVRTPEWLDRRIDRGTGAVCWFGQNVPDLATAQELSADLHARRQDLLVLCDEEGGGVTRIEAVWGSSWPAHAALGHLDDVGATGAVAAALGRQARAAGIDVVLAPDVDVSSDPANPVIGVRSFGADPALVARHASAFVTGLQSAGVAACAKHFPGHGATRTDSHLTLPCVGDPVEVLRERDIEPFAAAVRAGVRCVMTAHVLFPAYDDQPATMSARLLGLLRDELGFDGVIASDALDMHAISRGVGRGPGAVRALAAGVDLLCIGNPVFPEAYDAEAALDDVVRAILSALHDGTLSRARLEEAAARVQQLADWVVARRSDGQPGCDTAADREVGLSVARRCLETRGDVQLTAAPYVIDVAGPVNVAAGRRRPHVVDVLQDRVAGLPVATVDGQTVATDLAAALDSADGRELVVVVSTRLDDTTRSLLETVLDRAGRSVVVSTGSAGTNVPGDRVVATFGNGRALAEAAADLLGEGLYL